MNPRVSRSSALASKATGFPIAKIAAKLAVGYTLDELEQRHHARHAARAFEPTIDYVVVKWPRFAFEKFPRRDAGARPADEARRRGDGDRPHVPRGAQQGDRARSRPAAPGFDLPMTRDRRRPRRASSARSPIAVARPAVPGRPRRSSSGSRVERAHELTRDRSVVPRITSARSRSPRVERRGKRRRARRAMLRRSSGSASAIAGSPRSPARPRPRSARRATPPACARSTSASTPAPPSSRRTRRTCTRPTRTSARRAPTDRKKVIILGGGPNRIGQGIEFDYCCVHAAMALREEGYRDHHGQLQPRDGVDRLRHLRPPVLRAAHARGRARDLRRREAVGRDRAVRRADAAEARGPLDAGRRADPRHAAPTRSIAPRTASASTS